MAILDFSKAFDTVPHKELLNKLHSYGIEGNIHQWLSSVLQNRKMRVVVEGKNSDNAHVDSGVRQGTVLGPLLFLCHINDLPECVKSQVRLFADDCLLYREIKSQQDHQILQEDLKSLELWADKWGMKFKAKKCYITSMRQKSNYFYQLDQHILEQVKTNSYLGLNISDDLKWSSHISKITSKASCTLGFLRRNLCQCPQECKKCIIWDLYTNKNIDKLESIQKRAARFIKQDYKSRESGCVTNMLKDLEFKPLQERRKHIRLTMFYKVVEGLVPAIAPEDYLKEIRNKRKRKAKQYEGYETSNIIDRQTVNNSRPSELIQFKTDTRKNSFFSKTIVDWNHLEDSVVCAKTAEGFNSALQQLD
jgi:hypothetical protein